MLEKNILTLSTPIDKNFGIEFWCDNEDIVNHVRKTIFSILNKPEYKFIWFLQSNHNNYIFFEFWSNDQNKILEIFSMVCELLPEIENDII